MKNKKNNTNDLLARLGASLKESPLKAHARSATQEAPQKKTESPRKSQPKSVIMANEKPPEETPPATSLMQTTEKPKEVNTLDLAEDFLNTAIKLGAPLNDEQLLAAAELKKKQREGTLTSEEEKEAIEKLTLDDVQIARLEEMTAVRKMIDQLRKYKANKEEGKQFAANAKIDAPTSMPRPMIPLLPMGNARAGTRWRTSTVGLYPEDYEKAYAVMTYLMRETGQSVNLSRVVKIALRALEIGPEVLEINKQIRGCDGRIRTRIAVE